MKLAFQCIEPDGDLAVYDLGELPDCPRALFSLEHTAIDDLADALKRHLGSKSDGEPFIIDTQTGAISLP